MLGRAHRFHGLGSLRGVYSRGQSARAGQLSLKYGQRPAGRPYRVAVVVSRKVSKSAVVRNRIRRRIYEVVRLNPDLVKPGSDLVFTAYSDQLAEMETGKLRTLVKDLLQKASQTDH